MLGAPALLINLARRPERLAASLAALRAAGFTDVRRLEAIDGRDERALAAAWAACGDPPFAEWDVEFRQPGPQGCFLSHVVALQQVIAEELPYALIFEDDIFFHRHWDALAATYFALTPADYDVLYLGNAIKGPARGLVVREPCLCSHAYLVTLRGARLLGEALLRDPRGVYKNDIMVFDPQKEEREAGVRCFFDWYAWNGLPFLDRRAVAFPDWREYNTGLVFQNRELWSDLTGDGENRG